MSTTLNATQRSQYLKQLREEHRETVTQVQALLKEQKDIRRQICQAMRDTPKTVPEIAEASGLPADQVLWHIIAMKKYDLVIETGMCGEFYLYQRVKEAKE
jgi:predicted Rossmann fold nucleotide-binding protein DprA/Smf involved in DNA uptake